MFIAATARLGTMLYLHYNCLKNLDKKSQNYSEGVILAQKYDQIWTQQGPLPPTCWTSSIDFKFIIYETGIFFLLGCSLGVGDYR